MQRPYFLHPSLPSKVLKYMKENEYVDVGDMAAFLIKTDKEYQRKNLKAFIPAVRKAYEWNLYRKKEEEEEIEVSDSEEIEDSDGGGPDILEVPPEKSANSLDSSFAIDRLYQSPAANKNQKGKELNGHSKKNKNDSSPMVQNPVKKRKKEEKSNKEMPEFIKKKKNKSAFTSVVPTTTVDDLQGIGNLKQVLLVLCLNLKGNAEDFPLRDKLQKCVLLTGPRGSGKTSLINALAGSTKASLFSVSANDFLETSPLRSIEALVKEAFDAALSVSPSILHLQGLEVLSSKESGNRINERRVSRQINNCIKEIYTTHKEKNILVIAESSYPQNMDLELRSSFEEEIFMPILDKEARLSILKDLCKNIKVHMSLDEIALRTPSFVAGDLKALVDKASKQALNRACPEKISGSFSSLLDDSYSEAKKINVLEIQDFLKAIEMTIPVLKREGFPSVPETTWEDVGGLEDIKQELIEKIIEPIEKASLHKKYGCQRPNGILLWGPPGCGKTLLAKAVANHIGINLLPVRGPELLNMYQGESERAIREVFQKASSVAPCVIFFDEFDCLCPSRTSGSESGSKTTIVNTLLVEMNGFSQRKDVYVVAATNRPDMLDRAMMRPGRLDTSLYVGFPDLKGRVAVLKACTKNGTLPKLSSELNLEEISRHCEGFSGADCAQLVYLAGKEAIREESNNISAKESEKVGELFTRHFETAFKNVKPSVSLKERNRYVQFKKEFESTKKEGNKIFSFSQLITNDVEEESTVRSKD